MVWVPSHVGVRGNEAADQAVKAAALEVPAESAKIPASDLGAVAREHIFSLWSQSWEQEPSTNKLKEIKPNIGLWSSSFQRSRKYEVSLTRLRIGHCHGTHGFLLSGEGIAPPCSRCGGRRTVKHVLTECADSAAERRRLFGGNPSLTNLIGENPNVECEVVLKYLHLADFSVIYSPV